MYSIDSRDTGEQFCLLAKRALKAKKILRVKDNKEVEDFIAQPLEEYSFHVSGVEVISEDDEALTIAFHMGSN